MKAKILKIGSFDKKGKPINWEFDCQWKYPAIEIKNNGKILWGGYTIEELKEIEETEKYYRKDKIMTREEFLKIIDDVNNSKTYSLYDIEDGDEIESFYEAKPIKNGLGRYRS